MMTGPSDTNQRQGYAGQALDAVEGAGASVGNAIGNETFVVRKTRSAWQYFLIYPAVFGALLGAIPTGIELYKSFKYGIAVSEVAHAEEQKNLWIKNLRCVQDLTYHTVKTNDGAMVQIGACQNGDVLIEVIPSNDATPVAEWVSLTRVRAASAIGTLLVSKAYAASGSNASIVVAQAGTLKTMCTSVNPKAQTIEKILKNGNKCTRRVVKMIGGKMIKNEPVPCNTKCTPAG